MPRINKNRIVGDMDHAFEVVLIIITIISGIVAQAATGEEQQFLPPIIENIRKMSVVFVFPTIFTVAVWIFIYFTDDENWRMRYRTYSWGTALILLSFEATELYVICLPKNHPEWAVDVPIFVGFVSFIVPVIPFLLLLRILGRYKTVLKDIPFYTEEGIWAKVKRYGPYVLSCATFWFLFLGAAYT
jgi:hypothetical protein